MSDVRSQVAAAEAFLATARFQWWQRFELAPGVFTPGGNDIVRLLDRARLPDVRGLSVLDIGTANGGACFELERRGAARCVGVDIYDEHQFGFRQTADFLGSKAEFVQGNIYDLPQLLAGEQFDVVLFIGVIYHLRHPLLALDQLHALTGRYAVVETPICDSEAAPAYDPIVRFCRTDEWNGDFSNWFIPSATALRDWCTSCGLDVVHQSFGRGGNRILLGTAPAAGAPAFHTRGYERPVTVHAGGRPVST